MIGRLVSPPVDRDGGAGGCRQACRHAPEIGLQHQTVQQPSKVQCVVLVVVVKNVELLVFFVFTCFHVRRTRGTGQALLVWSFGQVEARLAIKVPPCQVFVFIFLAW